VVLAELGDGFEAFAAGEDGDGGEGEDGGQGVTAAAALAGTGIVASTSTRDKRSMTCLLGTLTHPQRGLPIPPLSAKADLETALATQRPSLDLLSAVV
jgi:hypothetical protein